MPMIDVAAAMLLVQRRCYNGTAIAESSGNAVWNENPTALLMNDITAKLYLCVRPSVLMIKEITDTGRHTMDAKQVIYIPYSLYQPKGR